MALAYGIDFGTTNSTICVADGLGNVRKLEIDPEADNPAVMRSVIYVSPNHRYLFGKPAVDAYLIDVAQNKATGKKSVFTGRYIKVGGDSTPNGVTKDKLIPEILEVDESANGRLFQALKSVLSRTSVDKIDVFGTSVKLDYLVGLFLLEMKQRADEIVGESVEHAMIGRPIQFVGENNDLAITRMKNAAQIAGFKEVQFDYEPVGAAFDYGVDVAHRQTALIFDFGGGTLDLSVIRFPERMILANVGLAIGGDHFNSEIFIEILGKYFGKHALYGFNQLPVPRHIFEELRNWYTISLLKTTGFKDSLDNFKFMNSDKKSIQALESLIFNNLGFSLYEEIDRVKKQLSIRDQETYELNAVDILINEIITKNQFEEIVMRDIESIEELLDQALQQAGIRNEDIDIVATTGGSSLIPIIQSLLIRRFGKESVRSKDAFTSVAAGLALRAKDVF